MVQALSVTQAVVVAMNQLAKGGAQAECTQARQLTWQLVIGLCTQVIYKASTVTRWWKEGC